MKSERIEFENAEGHTLAAKLERPLDRKPRAYAILAHCFTCSKDLKGLRNVAQGLCQEGIAVLRFDFTGLGESEGEFSETGLSSNVDDLIEAAEYLKEHEESPSILIGHSLGGAAVLLAAQRMEGIEAVATIGAPADPAHVKAHFQGDLASIEENGEAEVKIGGRPFKVKKSFIEELDAHKPAEELASLRKPLLVMHSPQDQVVGIHNAQRIYQAAHHPKSFISLDGADHLLSKKEDSLYVGSTIAAWAARYLPEKAEGLETDHPVAVRTSDESLTTDVVAGKHHFLADEPEKAGGNDMGPDPYGLLMAALGSCTSLTLQMYAKRKEWDLKEARVHLSHDKVHAKDCEDCESSSGKVDRFSRKIEVEGELSEEQRQRLLEIADKCPVHRTLHSEIVVDSELL